MAEDEKYNADDVRDLKLAMALLTGAWTQEGANPKNKAEDRRPGKRQLEGELERQAREAIGRLLRSRKPLRSTLRYYLAELFDGLPPYLSFEGGPLTRKIVFENRKAGQPKEIKLRNMHLAADYQELRAEPERLPHKKAVDRVCKKYGVSDTAVKEALRTNPDLVPGRAVKKLIKRPG